MERASYGLQGHWGGSFVSYNPSYARYFINREALRSEAPGRLAAAGEGNDPGAKITRSLHAQKW